MGRIVDKSSYEGKIFAGARTRDRKRVPLIAPTSGGF
jgi:hypothetical protein